MTMAIAFHTYNQPYADIWPFALHNLPPQQEL